MGVFVGDGSVWNRVLEDGSSIRLWHSEIGWGAAWIPAGTDQPSWTVHGQDRLAEVWDDLRAWIRERESELQKAIEWAGRARHLGDLLRDKNVNPRPWWERV